MRHHALRVVGCAIAAFRCLAMVVAVIVRIGVVKTTKAEKGAAALAYFVDEAHETLFLQSKAPSQ